MTIICLLIQNSLDSLETTQDAAELDEDEASPETDRSGGKSVGEEDNQRRLTWEERCGLTFSVTLRLEWAASDTGHLNIFSHCAHIKVLSNG
jgi:hypothetical protein